MQDIDTWVLVWSDSKTSYDPLAIVELKRSFKEPAEWEPYQADVANYIALKKLADRAGLPLWIIYFQKDVEIQDKTTLKVFDVSAVSTTATPWIQYRSVKIVSASDFRATFPKLF